MNPNDMVRLLSSGWGFQENDEASSRVLKLRSDLQEYNRIFQNKMKQVKIPTKRRENKQKIEKM